MVRDESFVLGESAVGNRFAERCLLHVRGGEFHLGRIGVHVQKAAVGIRRVLRVCLLEGELIPGDDGLGYEWAP